MDEILSTIQDLLRERSSRNKDLIRRITRIRAYPALRLHLSDAFAFKGWGGGKVAFEIRLIDGDLEGRLFLSDFNGKSGVDAAAPVIRCPLADPMSIDRLERALGLLGVVVPASNGSGRAARC